MQTRRATELSNKSGEILEQALQEPVVITKGRNERPIAVIISYAKYMQLTGNTHPVGVGQ